jgi:hypothetical protein
MKLVSTIAKAGLAVLALGTAGMVPAFAQSNASAAVSLVGYELVDLDLGDGIAPWLSFQDMQLAWSQASIFPGSSPDAVPLAQSASWSGNLAAVDAGWHSARAQAGPDDVWSSASGDPNLVWSSALTRRGFLLSPNTGVTFFFDTDLYTTAGGGSNEAMAGMKVTFGSEAFPVTVLGVRDGAYYSGSLTAYADVRGTEAVQGTLWMTTYTETGAAAAPVPEPAAPVMLLGGLGLLAAWKRRRQA